jgi:hypothetical protein
MACGCSVESKSTNNSTDEEGCTSFISWVGRLAGSADQLTVEGCLNDDCLTREVPVEPDEICDGVGALWVDDWGSTACANISNADPAEIGVVFSLDLSLRQSALREGDVGTLTIKDSDTGVTLFKDSDVVPYQGGFDPPCAWAGITFGNGGSSDGGTPPVEDAGD